MKQKVLYSFCVVIGFVFIVSGLGKVVNTSAFGNLIVQYGLERLQILAPIIIIVEFTIGLCFVLKIKLKIIGIISACMLLIFTIVFTYGHLKTGITDCGCFGTFKIINDNIVLVYARNIFLFVLSIIVGVYYPTCQGEKTDNSKIMILFGVLMPVIFVTGLTYKIPSFFGQKQTDFLHKNVTETPLREYIQTDRDSSYWIFIYQYSCPHCLNSIENLKQYEKLGVVDRVIALSSITDSIAVERFNNFFQPNFTIKNYPLEQIAGLTDKFPVSYYIKGNVIKMEIIGALPCGYLMLQKLDKSMYPID